MIWVRMASGIIILYLISLAVSAILHNSETIFAAKVLIFSLIIFAVFIIIFSVALAVVLAIKKRPIIENGNYELSRIKGKNEQ